jgi:hypothetical protein
VERKFTSFLFFHLCTPHPRHPTQPRGYSRRVPPWSLLPPTALPAAGRCGRTRVGCQIPLVSLFNSPLLSLYLHESMAGRPSPTATRRMHGRLWGRARAVRLAGSAPFSSMSVYQSEGNMPRRREVCTTALPTSDVERNPHCVSFSR